MKFVKKPVMQVSSRTWAIFAVILLLASNPVWAQSQKWDFSNADEFRYDANKIEVQNKKAALKKRAPYQDKGPAAFDLGINIENIASAGENLSLIRQKDSAQTDPLNPVPVDAKISGLTALWHFDEPSGTNVLDEIGRNVAKSNDAEIVSGQTGFGYARLFDGAKSHIFIPQYDTFDFTHAFTIESWIRPVSATRGKAQTIISRWQTIGGQKSFALQISSEGKIDFKLSPDGGTTAHVEGETVLTPGRWYHVAGVFSGTDIRVYVNGVLDQEPVPFAGPVFQTVIPIYVGTIIENKMTDFFEGVIDEISFYSAGLTEDKLRVHFGNLEGVIAHWKLDERAGLLEDSSGFGHSAVAHGDPEFGAAGKEGLAISLNGKNQYLEISPSYQLGPDGSLTLEAWINPQDLPGQDQFKPMISSVGGETDFELCLAGPDAHLRFKAASLSPADFTGGYSLTPKVWSHVAVTAGSGSVKIYVNGRLDISAPFSGMMKTGKAGIRLGADRSQVTYFNGLMDDVIYYRRVKSDAEISAAAHQYPKSGIYLSKIKDAGSSAPWQKISWQGEGVYHQPSDKDEVGLLHLYHLDDPDETVLLDEKSEIPMDSMGTYSVPGVFSQARWFSKRGYDKLISQKQFPALSTYTISLWAQFRNPEPGGTDRLFSIGDESPSIYRSAPDGRLQVVSQGARKIMSDKTLMDSSWHHIALTSDGKSLFLYIDGERAGQTSQVGATSAEPLVLGNLKSGDTFEGAIDEFALFNAGLDDEAVRKLALRGKLDAKFLVRTSDQDTFQNAIFRGPKGNNLVDLRPMATTIALWHLNEKVLRGAANEVSDESRYANHGIAYGGNLASSNGVISRGIQLNGASDFIEIPDAPNLRLRDSMTLSAWVRPDEVAQDNIRILDKRFLGGAPVFSSFALEILPGNRLGFRLGHDGGYHLETTDRDGEISVGRWAHVAATFNGKEIKLFINGKLRKSARFDRPLIYDKGALFIGRYGSGPAGFFRGGLDEVMIDQKAMEDSEIATIFLNADPENYFRGQSEQKIDVAPGRFFQYLLKLDSEDAEYSPEISSVSVQGNDFSVDRPFVVNALSVSYADISSISQSTGANHKGAITYQISNDSSNWYYHNGRHWVLASSVTESNTMNQVAQQIRNFPKEVGIGSFYFKAFLHSLTGIEPAELESVDLEYLPNKLTVTSPNGGEGWLVGAEQAIKWNTAGEVATVRIEYSRDHFKKDFQVISKETPNQGSFLWKVPDTVSPSVKVRVMDSLDPRIYDASDLTFRIAGALEVVAPNYQERWEVGSKQKISWRTLGTMPNIKIDFSTDHFKNQIFPIVDSVKNEGEFTWAIPDQIGKTLRVRISDVNDPLTYDVSNDTFTIHGHLNLLSPEPSARWLVGSSQEIRWKTNGVIPAVKIEFGMVKEDGTMEWQVLEKEFLNRNAYIWQVPDTISSKMKIRISDPRDLEVKSESGDFAVVGGLGVMNPVGGEFWTVGSKRKIAWKTTGTLSQVNLEYALLDADAKKDLAAGKLLPQSKNIQWKSIESGVPNIGSYVWTVPDNLSAGVAVRVTDVRDDQVFALTPKTFQIIPGFVLRHPNGKEAWLVGSDQSIEWDTKGSIDSIKLEYSKDEFKKDIHTIIEKASNLGRFVWTVPDDASSKIWIRISDPSMPQASDISDVPFRIHGSFHVNMPFGGEKYEAGSLGNIAWDTLGTIPKVKIEYSHDDFNKDVRTIVESTANKGQWTWSVPDDISSGLKIRISDASDPLAFNVGEGFFSIVGKFHLTYPAGGENLVVGTIQKISWKGAGSIPVVRIDYSEDDFTKSFITIADAAPNTGTFNWEVPNLLGKSLKIRVWDPAHPESVYVMEAPFRVVGGFTLSAPNGGETIYVGEPFDITWQTFGNVERVKLELSSDHFQKKIWEVAGNYENLGVYRWTVPDLSAGLYMIRISDQKDPVAFDISNSDFRIRSRIKLIAPSGGEGWQVGEKRGIQWKTSGTVEKIKLEYSTDDFKSAVTIVDAVTNTGHYDWTVPNKVSKSMKIRVSDASDAGASAVTDSSIKTQAILKLVTPKGGEIWRVGHSYPIVWQTTGEVKAVRLECSRDGFVSEAKVIMPSLENTGAYNWTVPDEITKHMKVRVVDLSNANTVAVSPKEFQVAGSFQVLSPNGGEVWHALEKREISWVTVGTVPEVDLSFCVETDDPKAPCISNTANNEAMFIIDKNITNQGKYIWDLPRTIGERFRFKICDSSQSEICDLSDQTFVIRTPLEIVHPRGGELWPVGSDQEIRWQTFGNVSRILVQYAKKQAPEKGKSSEPIQWKTLTEGLDNQGHFLFKVPDDVSKQIIFKVADWDDEELFATTSEPVMFSGTFTLNTPQGGEKWAAGSTQRIIWETQGTVSNVRIEYSTDQFAHDVNVIESSYSNTGTYAWTLPAFLSDTARIRISDTSNPKSFVISDEPFKMMAGFVMLAPDGGEVWKVGSKQRIQWKTIGKVDKVQLEYQTAGEWKKITGALPNGGEFGWVVPNDVSKSARLRVSDFSDEDAQDISNQAFEIRADLLVVRPNGKDKFVVGEPAEIRWVSIGNVGTVKLEYSKDHFQKDLHLISENVVDKPPFLWTPGDDVSETVQIRVTSELNPQVFDVSDEAFKIIPRIRMVTPHGGESWIVDSNEVIEWDWRGTVDAVNIDASTNDFRSSIVIARDLANTGRFSWKIPDMIHSKIRVRIQDAKHPDALVISEFFKIMPGFEMIRPNGGESWKVGEQQMLQWKTFGSSPKINLQYAILKNKEELIWKNISKAMANKGQFQWQVPADVSSNVKVRVVDAEDAAALDVADKPFKILAVFDLRAPQSGKILTVGDTTEIQWTTVGSVPQVKLEYSPADKLNGEPEKFLSVADIVENKGTYKWIIPDSIGENLRVKISDASEPESFVVSEPFAVRGKLTGNITEGQLNWQVGSMQTIFWKSVGSIAQVDLSYRLPDKMEWKPIAKGIPNSGSYGWTVPDDVAKDISIRVSDASNAQVFDILGQKITIAARFEFLQPKAEDFLIVGAKKEIGWKTFGKVQRLYLDYSLNGGNWFSVAGPIPDSGKYLWIIPDAISKGVRLRVRDGENDAAFTISSVLTIHGTLEMTMPKGDEVWSVGQTRVIEWKTLGTIPQVKLELVESSAQQGGEIVNLIKEDMPNGGRFEWIVPDRISDHLKIRVSDIRDKAVRTSSPNEFSIVGSFDVLSPKGGESWTVGSQQQIAWTSRGSIPMVNLIYSRDDFKKDMNIFASGIPNTGISVWKIPDVMSEQIMVRVVDANDPRAFGDAAHEFKIQGNLVLTAPGPDEKWTVGETKAVTWTTTGSIENIRLEYSADDFQKDVRIMENSISNSGRYEWKVPDLITNNLRIRVKNAKDASISSASHNVKVQGKLKLLTHQKHEELRVFSHSMIRWTTTGTVAKIRVEYSRDNFHNDIHPIVTNTANVNTLDWVVPDDIGSAVKIRVSDEYNTNVSDTIPESLDIQGSLAFAESGHPERLAVSSKKELFWNTIGTIPSVRLEYSKDEEFLHPTLMADQIKNRGTYLWTVPDDITDNIWFRVTDTRTPSVFALSENPASVIGTLRLLEPPAGSVFPVGSSQTVKWSSVGTIPEIRFEYSTSGAEAVKAGQDVWNLVSGSFENAGTYSWKIPNDVSNFVRVRISDARDPQVQSISEGFYQIWSQLQILEPSGKERWIVGTEHELVWNSIGALAKVRLEYSRDQFNKDIQLIKTDLTNTGHYTWEVPDAISNHIQVRVLNLNDARVLAVSQPFMVMGDIIFVEPEGDLVWAVGSEKTLEWQTIGTIPQVKLEYSDPVKSPKDPLEFRLIQQGLLNQGRYTWKIPDAIGEGILIRISDVRDPATTVVTQKPIKIAGDFQFRNPKQGMGWLVGEVAKLEWETLGTVSRVHLDVSNDGFQEKVFEIEKSRANENSYFWQVPDLIGKDVRLRIRDADDPKISVVSEPFQIRGGLRFLPPSGERIFKVGDLRRLEWQTIGTIPSVNLEYSFDKFAAHQVLIETITDNSGRFDWKVPDAIQREVWLRVRNAEDPSIFSDVSTPIQIQGTLNLLEPIGPVVLKVGNQATIRWNSTGTIPQIRLEYSEDGFQRSRQVIAESIPNQGSYSWTIPDFIRSKVDMRVLSATDASLESRSAEPFKIEGALNLLTLKEDDIWKVGDRKLFEWITTGTIPQVRVEYSADEFRQDSHILYEGIANQNSVQWVIPDDLSGLVRFRISDVRDPKVVSYSKGAAKIFGIISMVTPRGGESLLVGQEMAIQWKSQGDISKVSLEYSFDGFKWDIRPIAKLAENQGKLLWKIPDAISENAQIRVFDASNRMVMGVSNPFHIRGNIEILRPIPTDIFRVGSEERIEWKTTGTIQQFRLEYSMDRFDRDIRLINRAVDSLQKENQNYVWQIPDAITEHAWLRISDAKNPKVQTVIERPFKIKGNFELMTPKGGEVLSVEDKTSITWKTVGTLPRVNLEFSRDGFKNDRQIIMTNLLNQGFYEWTVPDAVSERVWVRVLDASDGTVSASHSDPMKIQGRLVLTKPTGEQIWKVGTDQSIEWKNIGSIPEVRLEYSLPQSALKIPVSTQAGSRPESFVIQDRLPNRGNFRWRIPENLPPSIRLRVVDASNPQIYSEAAQTVKLQSILRMVSPVKSEKWRVGSKQDILWETRGFLPQVKIEYSRDGFRRETTLISPLAPNNGRLTWTVPDMISDKLAFRVSDPDDLSVQAVTEFPIEIQGALQLDEPSGGERWAVGTDQTITWQTLGTISMISLEYSKDGFLRHHQPMIDRTANIGRFRWRVPDDIGEHVWLRVIDSQHQDVFSTSEQPFAIIGGLFMKQPSGSEIWTVGSTQMIEWDTLGSIANVRLEYSTDDFLNATAMTGVLRNSGKYTWQVPDVVSNQLRIRVSDAQDASVFAVTSSPVKIQGVLKFVSPREDDFWVAGSQKVISWQTQGSVPYVTLEYSSDNFSNATPIILGLANSGSYSWTVPDLAAEDLQIRIANSQDQNVFSVSSLFHVGGTVQLLTPSGGEAWKVGEKQEIRWKTLGNVPKVKLEASTDQFRNDIQVITGQADNAGSYLWEIPDWIRPTVQVRVSDVRNPRIFDVSPGPFQIIGELKILKPQGGESWKVGSHQDVTWKTLGTIQRVRIEYSADNFHTSMPIAMDAPNTGVYDWQIPDLVGSEIKIRVSDLRNPSVFSDMPYSALVQGGFRMLQPQGGETWSVGSEQILSWTTIGSVSNVNLEYSDDDFMTAKPIAMGIANRGTFLWKIPNLNTRNLRVRVMDATNPVIFDVSPRPVKVLGQITLLQPRGGEVFTVGRDLSIRWNAIGMIDRVRIEYTTDQFKSALPVVNEAPNSGEYIWKVPDSISKQARIRIIDAGNPAIFGETLVPFEIRGGLSFMSPAGGEVWQVSQRYPISWNSLGSIPQVRLEYSGDDFKQDVQVMASNLVNKGIYYWDVPVTVGGELKFRVVDTATPEVSDVTPAPVRIAGKIDLIYPTWSETFQVGEKVEIQWRSSPNIQTVKVEYSLDDFNSSEVVSAVAPNSGHFAWNVPDRITDKLKIRVSDAQNSTVFAVSPNPMRIRGSLRLLYPAGGEVWAVGSLQRLTWSTGGTVPEVRLEYSPDDFASVVPIISKTANTGSYEWKIPEMSNRDIRVRITYLGDQAVTSTSIGSVRILGQLKMISPNGGERWITNEERNIRWQTLGSVPRVTIEYSKDDFQKDVHLLASDAANLGTYFWTLPNDRSSEVKIRVRSQEDPTVYAISQAPFMIDHYKIRWMIQDAQTQTHLTGLVLTDSAGQTQTAITSPMSMERPYGIYTTVWSLPGYKEFKSTWVADSDRSFAVLMEKTPEALEQPRVNFDYDARRDLVKITSWYEREGKSVPGVIHSEVRIYEGARLLQTLSSSNPDSSGHFQMVWATKDVPGNSRYLASASVTLSNGRAVSSPIGFQIDLPVKSSAPVETYRPISTWQPSKEEAPLQTEKDAKEQALVPQAEELSPSLPSPASRTKKKSATEKAEAKVLVPESAVYNEVIAVQFWGQANSLPVMDVYDSNQRMILRGVQMPPAEELGHFSYLLKISGAKYLTGKPITIIIVDLKTGQIVTKEIQIQSSSNALGFSREAGSTTVLNLLQKLENAVWDLKNAGSDGEQIAKALSNLDHALVDLSVNLTPDLVDGLVLGKLNRAAQDLGKILSHKGMDARFLLELNLTDSKDMNAVSQQIRQFQAAVAMLRQLYQSSGRI